MKERIPGDVIVIHWLQCYNSHIGDFVLQAHRACHWHLGLKRHALEQV